MNAEDCITKAQQCVVIAELSTDESVASEFLGLSAQWRSLAVREIYLGLVNAHTAKTPSNTNKDEALSALEVLGFNKKLAEKSVERIVKENPEASVESIIKQALKQL